MKIIESPYILSPGEIQTYLTSRGITTKPRSMRAFLTHAREQAQKGATLLSSHDLDSTNYKTYLYGR